MGKVGEAPPQDPRLKRAAEEKRATGAPVVEKTAPATTEPTPENSPKKKARQTQGAQKPRPVTAPAARPEASVPVASPSTAIDKLHFDKLVDRLGLRDAFADGVVTESELKAVGLASEPFQRAQYSDGSSGAVDSYYELLRAAGTLPGVKTWTAADLAAGVPNADYLVFTAKANTPRLMPLMNHRALEGRQVAIIDPDEVVKHYMGALPKEEALARFVEDARARWTTPPKFLLLAGVVAHNNTVPVHFEGKAKNGHAFMRAEQFASDNAYGAPDARGVPQVAVGRLDSVHADHLNEMVRTVIRYEAQTMPGLWQTRAVAVDGSPNWGAATDKAVSAFAARETQDTANPAFDNRALSFNQFSGQEKNATQSAQQKLLSDGLLYLGYAGHGGPWEIDGLKVENLWALNSAGNVPLVAITACYAGDFDRGNSLTLELVRRSKAIGAIGASQVSMPHNNAAWARIMAEEVQSSKAATVGEVMINAKKRFAENDVDGWAATVNSIGEQGLGALGAVGIGSGSTKKSHLYLYNLAGDPAAKLRRPVQLEKLDAARTAQPGLDFPVKMKLPAGMEKATVEVSFESPLNGEKARTMIAATGSTSTGQAEVSVVLPPNMPKGTYNVRVAAVGETDVAIGVVTGVTVGKK